MSFAPTFEEALRRKQIAEAKRAARPKRKRSQAAKAGAKRRAEKREVVDQREEEWRLEVCVRDDWKCQYPGCKVRHKSIDAHHICERSQRPDLKYVKSNGACLCRKHHSWVHANPAQAVEKGLLSYRSYELASKEGMLGVR